jgi:hypothetical protein
MSSPERVIEKMRISAKNLANYHYKKLRRLTREKSVLTYITLTFGPASGLCAGFQLYTGLGVSLSVTVLLIAFVQSVILSVIKFNKYGENIESHRLAANRYNSLSNTILRQLITHKTSEELLEYYDLVAESFQKIVESSPCDVVPNLSDYLEDKNVERTLRVNISHNDKDEEEPTPVGGKRPSGDIIPLSSDSSYDSRSAGDLEGVMQSRPSGVMQSRPSVEDELRTTPDGRTSYEMRRFQSHIFFGSLDKMSGI